MLRGACTLYIVGFWHLLNYTTVFSGYYNSFTIRFTVVVLGLFVFLSGYLLNIRGIEPNLIGIKNFFIKRFLRIYPLYILAIIWFYFSQLDDGYSLLKAVFLISMFYGPPPPTLWFITMIMCFYLVAPALIVVVNQVVKFWLLAIFMFSMLVMISLFSSKYDLRILIYFPAFVAGIYVARSRILYTNLSFIVVLICLLLSIVSSMMIENTPESSYISIPLASFGPIILFMFFSRYSDFVPNINLFGIISYAGFVMYLVHRPIYKIMKHLYSDFPLIMNGNLQILMYLFLVCLPIVILISWYIQKTYDDILKFLGASFLIKRDKFEL